MGACLYVGNLPYSADGAQLVRIFGSYGEVVEARVITDRDSGQSKDFGFVEMGSGVPRKARSPAPIGTVLEGCALRVSVAAERSAGASQDPSGWRW